VNALLAVLDSAALFLALSPKSAPVVSARLCLRGGFECFGEVARAMGIEVPQLPDPDAGISLSYEEFLDAVARMRKVDFPIERDPAEAWCHLQQDRNRDIGAGQHRHAEPGGNGQRLSGPPAAPPVACGGGRAAHGASRG
jgi:hypothetical protein